MTSGSFCAPRQHAQDAIVKPPNGHLPLGLVGVGILLSAQREHPPLNPHHARSSLSFACGSARRSIRAGTDLAEKLAALPGLAGAIAGQSRMQLPIMGSPRANRELLGRKKKSL